MVPLGAGSFTGVRLVCCGTLGVGVAGVIDWVGEADGITSLLAVAPEDLSAVPPGRTDPEKAAWRDSWSVWYLEMLTEEIENSTMNSAISSVIMSA